MKTVQDYLDLGVEFAKGDVVIGYKNIEYSKNWHESLQDDDSDEGDIWLDCNIKSFVWRNNDGVKPEYNGAMKVELSSGDVIFNCGKTSEFDWRINDDVNPKILRWKPIVISDGIAGCGYSFAINECQNPSFLQHKPKINLIVPDSLKAEVRRAGGEINVTITQKYKQAHPASSLEQVISIDTVCDVIKSVSPKEDKLMKPVYTAEMHARNELPPVGADCILIIDSEPRQARVTYIGKSLGVCSNIDGGAEYAFLLGKASFKPIIKTIKVNGFDVPAPMSEAPEHRQMVYLASSAHIDFNLDFTWQDDEAAVRWLSRGLIHSTKSAAIAHAKAMLGINPNPARGGDGHDRNVLGQNNEGDEI